MAAQEVGSVDTMVRESFLRAILPPLEEGQVYRGAVNAFVEGPGDSAGTWTEYEAPSLEDLSRLYASHVDQGECYVATATFAAGGSRSPAHTIGKRVLSVDLDEKAMPGTTPGKRQHCARALASALPCPTAVVRTGGGFHLHVPLIEPLWLESAFDQADGVDQLELMARALRLWLEAKAMDMFGERVELDRTHGVSRVWRVCPSWNMKHETRKRVLDSRRTKWRPVELRTPGVEQLSRMVRVDVVSFLRPYFDPASFEAEEQSAKGGDAYIAAVRSSDGQAFKLDMLGASLLGSWPMLIGDQSANDFNLACELVENGHTQPEILADAIRMRRSELPDPADQAKGARDDYLSRTIARALAHTEPQLAFRWSDETDRREDTPLDQALPVPEVTNGTHVEVTAEPFDPERYAAALKADLDRHSAGATFRADRASSAEAYSFPMAWPEGHFVRRYVLWASGRTDAAWDYHEASALAALAACTSNVRGYLPPYPKGIGTNLYLLLLGNTTSSRKSTSIGLARAGVLESVDPDSILPDRLTPEAFVERMGKRQGQAACWIIDEFGSVVADMHNRPHMQALREILLTVYGGNDYRYARRSKPGQGKKMEDDEAVVRNPNLTVLAGGTPELLNQLHRADIGTGLMPRFAVIYPKRKPPRKPIWQAPANAEAERRELARWASDIAAYNVRKPEVEWEHEALRKLDAFGESIEDFANRHPDSVATVMFQRLPPMALKVALLSAIGRPLALPEPGSWEPPEGKPLMDTQPLRVTVDDARVAVEVLERWRAFAEDFAQGIQQDPFGSKVESFLRALAELGGRALRRDLSRRLRTDKRTMDGILETLLEREDIKLERVGRGHLIVRNLPGLTE